MSVSRALLLALGASSSLASARSAVGQPGRSPEAAPIVTIVSADSSLRIRNTRLRIVVRDVDGPHPPIDQASIQVGGLDSNVRRRPTVSIKTDERGQVTATAPDSGDYSVVVRRVGYHEARFDVRLRPNCDQTLEVYIARSVHEFDRCQVKTSVSPPCDPGTGPTSGRGVFTTCAHAA